jgi:methylmalonyl-CoA mutase C-terminal domain/subunit
MQRKIRVLVGKPGLDGHDRGAKVVAAALRDGGMEVIYTGLHQTAEQIVEAAAQEDVDVVALSILSGAHMTLFPEVMKLMRARGIGDRLLTGGGIIPAEDMASLARAGVGRLFGPGASTQDIARYIREWFKETYPGESSGSGAPRTSRRPARGRAGVATAGRGLTGRAKPKLKPKSKPKPKPKPKPKSKRPPTPTRRPVAKRKPTPKRKRR